MSVIIFHNGTMTSDYTGFHDADGLDTFCQIEKIFQSTRGDAFLGVVGKELLGDAQKIIELLILTAYGKENPIQRKELMDLTDGRSLTLLTKDAAYSYGSINYRLDRLKEGRNYCWGEGQIHALTALHVGKSPAEAIEIYHRIAYGTTSDTVPKTHMVRQEDCATLDLSFYLPKEEDKEDE